MLALLMATLVCAPPADAKPLRIRAVGDVMLGTTFPEGYLPPDDGAHLLDGVAPLLRDADLTFANLEGPLCDGGSTNKCRRSANCYAFRMPTAYGRYLKEAGIDVVSTANNHSGDFGEECRRATEKTLDALGIAWSGPPGSIAVLERGGRKIAVIAFHTSEACNYLNDHETAAALVRHAKRSNEFVVVSFHGGAEGAAALHVAPGRELFHGENRGSLRDFAHRVIDAGADLVLGHGPHVARAMELYRGHLIAYSMGNFATYGRFNLSGAMAVGMVLEVELAASGRFVRGHIFGTHQEGEGIPRIDTTHAAAALVRRLTDDDFPKTSLRISSSGAISAGTDEAAPDDIDYD